MPPIDDFDRFFHAVTGKVPFPYQRALAAGAWPDLLEVPTGLGKTAAVVLAWLWKRHHHDDATGRRLVYCLPMRTLVKQTADEARAWCAAAASYFAGTPPTVHVLMGGDVDQTWDVEPERDHVIVGTQDLLLSRALGRGYAMSRYRWPVHFGLLNNDCFWVFDETQLMGVGVETGAQLDGLRAKLGAWSATRSLWMSATLAHGQLATVDHPPPEDGWRRLGLGPDDHDVGVVSLRVDARKRLLREDVTLTTSGADAYAREVAERVLAAAARGGLTLAVFNRVARAQSVYARLRGLTATPVALVHSRFRRADRDRQQEALSGDGDRIVVATQALEAGVDVSARTLFTELAPWPSLVQRFGRCNRYGELENGGGEIRWIPIDTTDEGLALPYEGADLAAAEGFLERLQTAGGDAGPASLKAIDHVPEPRVRPVVRRRDVVQLFDTPPDLLGRDVDVSRFVRDEKDTDVRFFWRRFESRRPTPAEVSKAPAPDELAAVSVRSANVFLGELKKLRQRLEKKPAERDAASRLRPWRWDALSERWDDTDRARPGDVLLLPVEAGGYDRDLGWTGVAGGGEVEEVGSDLELDGMGRDSRSLSTWVELTDHLEHVSGQATRLTAELRIEEPWAVALVEAARWHDVGKAHPEFQQRLTSPVAGTPERAPRENVLWAKSAHRKRAATERPYFRHELASALAWLKAGPEIDPRLGSLIAFLIAAHHGKVRLSIRSVPDEQDGLVRGIAEGDRLPEVPLPGGTTLPSLALSLAPVHLGEESWQGRVLRLRDDPELGPFRLAWLEAVLRAADAQASNAEESADA
jgi:CRISPR-associated endonuclease/helicase Cas3